MTWLDPLRRALDARPDAATFFFRDDDAGPADDRLFRLVDLFALYRLPLDLAVIPATLDASVAALLATHRRSEPTLLGLHQHGYAHRNHESTGRACEFGDARPAAEQAVDLAAGRRRLCELLGAECDPIFTPPWNRCSQACAAALPALGFIALSRAHGATPRDTTGLAELDVDVDWVKLAARDRGGPPAAAGAIAAALAARDRCGVMLHHAVMSEEHFAALERLLELLARHRRVRPAAMRELVAARPEHETKESIHV